MVGSAALTWAAAVIIGLKMLFAVAKIYEIADTLKEIRDKKV